MADFEQVNVIWVSYGCLPAVYAYKNTFKQKLRQTYTEYDDRSDLPQESMKRF